MDETCDSDIYLEDARMKAASKVVEVLVGAQIVSTQTETPLSSKSQELLNQASDYLIRMFKEGTKECQNREVR